MFPLGFIGKESMFWLVRSAHVLITFPLLFRGKGSQEKGFVLHTVPQTRQSIMEGKARKWLVSLARQQTAEKMGSGARLWDIKEHLGDFFSFSVLSSKGFTISQMVLSLGHQALKHKSLLGTQHPVFITGCRWWLWWDVIVSIWKPAFISDLGWRPVFQYLITNLHFYSVEWNM